MQKNLDKEEFMQKMRDALHRIAQGYLALGDVQRIASEALSAERVNARGYTFTRFICELSDLLITEFHWTDEAAADLDEDAWGEYWENDFEPREAILEDLS